MKSKRAKEALRVLPLNKANVEYCLERGIINGSLKVSIENIVCLAEQDAEERAVEAANLLYEDLKPILLHPMAREWVIDKFKEFYNDGGQSDDE